MRGTTSYFAIFRGLRDAVHRVDHQSSRNHRFHSAAGDMKTAKRCRQKVTREKSNGEEGGDVEQRSDEIEP
jgi:hypothetical protein